MITFLVLPSYNPAILVFLNKLSIVDCICIKVLKQSPGILVIAIADKRGLGILRRGFATLLNRCDQLVLR